MKTEYFLYARKSTEDEDRQIMSIEAQLVELTEFASRENLTIAEKFIESKSAKRPGRKIFGKMIEKIHASKNPVGILIWHPDRLARNSIDGGQIIYLIDTKKIVSLRSPTFWFEPTPQGLFMLQVAFGQSKYYSDNLSQNIKRGIRQKLRRGEWTMPAPYGYINNRKTKNIEPDPVKSKIIKKAYEEFAQGKHTMKSISERLAFWGILSKRGKPLVSSAISRMLTNKIYLGLIVYNGETYEGSFPPLISKKLYDDVQKVLQQRARKKRSKTKYNFPFTGLLTCTECGCSISAQYAKGHGGIYCYYRCTKRRGKCSQKYLRDNLFAEQIKKKLKTISLPEKWTEKMLLQIDAWEKEQKESSGKLAGNLNEKIEQVSLKLDKLVDGFLDGIIDKEIYLVKKNKLVHQKTSFYEKKDDFRKKGYASIIERSSNLF